MPVRPDWPPAYGGEEFAILLPGVQRQEATWIAETLRAAVEVLPIHTPQSQINVTISVGVAVFPEHGRSPEELLATADAALYEAKESGRNRVIIATPVTRLLKRRIKSRPGAPKKRGRPARVSFCRLC